MDSSAIDWIVGLFAFNFILLAWPWLAWRPNARQHQVRLLAPVVAPMSEPELQAAFPVWSS